MTKKELIAKIAETTEKTQKDVSIVLDAFQDIVKDTVKTGEKVAFTGFLTFEKKHVDAKSGISHVGGAGKEWTSPEKDVITVKLSKSYKEL